MKKVNKIQKIALGLVISGIVVGSAATTAVILTRPSHNEHGRADDLNMLHVPLKVQSKHVPTDFDDATSAPSEIMDYIKEILLSDDGTLETVSGEVNYEDGTIITTVSYRIDDNNIKTDMFLFEGWAKVPRIDHRNIQLQAELFQMVRKAILPAEPTDPKYIAKFHALQAARTSLLDKVSNWRIPTKEILTPLVDKLKKLIAKFNEEIRTNILLQTKKEILKSLVIPTKMIYIGATTTLKFNPYVKPTNDEIDSLSVEGVNKAISKTNNAIHDNNLYNKAILREIQKANDKTITYLRMELNSLTLLKQIIPNPGVVVVLSFNNYKPVNINSMSKEQLKRVISKVKEANKNNANYNNEVNAKNKEQRTKINKLKSIASTIISKKIATSADIPTHKFEKYTLPDNVESLTIVELKKEIAIAQQIVINDKIYNEEMIASNKNAKVAAKVLHDKKKVLLSIKQPKELITSFKIAMTIHFENYTPPTDLDSLSLEQTNHEITIANNIKNHNNRYNNLLKSKIIAVQELATEQTSINALIPKNVHASKSTHLVVNGVFNNEIATLYGLKVTLKSNFTYLYTSSSNGIIITVSQSSTIKSVAPVPIHITLQLTEIEEFRHIYGKKSITDDGDGVITIHDMGDKYLNVDSKGIKTMKSGFTIPQGVTTIGNGFLYYSTNMPDNFTIPSSVTSIGTRFLYSSTNMADNFTIPSSVTSIGDYFLNSSTNMVDNFTIPSSVISIGNYFLSFSTNMANNFTIPDSVTSIGNYFLFSSTNMAGSFTIPSSLTFISDNFLYSSTNMANNFTIPSSVKSISYNFLLSSTNMADNFTIPSSVTSIGSGFLTSSSNMADNFTIPQGVTSIGDWFLSSSTNMADNFTIPSSVTSIGQGFLNSISNMRLPRMTTYNQIWNGNVWVEAPRSTPSSLLEDELILQTEDTIGIYRP